MDGDLEASAVLARGAGSQAAVAPSVGHLRNAEGQSRGGEGGAGGGEGDAEVGEKEVEPQPWCSG